MFFFAVKVFGTNQYCWRQFRSVNTRSILERLDFIHCLLLTNVIYFFSGKKYVVGQGFFITNTVITSTAAHRIDRFCYKSPVKGCEPIVILFNSWKKKPRCCAGLRVETFSTCTGENVVALNLKLAPLCKTTSMCDLNSSNNNSVVLTWW